MVALKEDSARKYTAPPAFRWPNGGRVAIFFQVVLEGWSDGQWPGVGPMANPLKPGFPDTNAISWAEYGPRHGIYNLLAILDRHKIPASVVVNGVIAERHPEAVRAVAAAGHEIVAHAWGMDVMSIYLSEDEERDNIARTTSILHEVGGVRPTGWISPRGTGGLHTNWLLAGAGYEWHGDRLDSDLPTLIDYGDRGIVGITSSTEVNDAPLHVRHGNPPRMLVEIFTDTLAAYRDYGEPAGFNVTLHCHVFGRVSGAWALDRIVETARQADGVWIGTKLAAARHFRSVLGR